MKKSNSGLLFYLWLGVIITPVAIECSHRVEPTDNSDKHCGYIKPLRPKEFDDRSGVKTKSWEKPKVTTYKHLYHTSKKSGVVLRKGNQRIATGMTSEEIVNQLSLDYQDLYDYYGGAEEIY